MVSVSLCSSACSPRLNAVVVFVVVAGVAVVVVVSALWALLPQLVLPQLN